MFLTYILPSLGTLSYMELKRGGFLQNTAQLKKVSNFICPTSICQYCVANYYYHGAKMYVSNDTDISKLQGNNKQIMIRF